MGCAKCFEEYKARPAMISALQELSDELTSQK